MSLGKGQLRETRTVAEAVFFFLMPIFKLSVWRKGERKGRKREGRPCGRVKAR